MSSGVVGLCIWLTANSSLLFCADATPEIAIIVTAANNPFPILRAALPVQNSLLQLIFTSFSFLTQVVQLHFPSSFHLKFADRLVVRCEMSAAFVGQKHVHGATIPERSKKSRLAHNEKQEYFLRRRVVKRISRKCARV